MGQAVEWATRREPFLDFASIKALEFSYHGEDDTAFVHVHQPRPAVSLDVGGDMWLRVDPDTDEVVGLEVHAFAKGFLIRHSKIATFADDTMKAARQKFGPDLQEIHTDCETLPELRDFLLFLLGHAIGTYERERLQEAAKLQSQLLRGRAVGDLVPSAAPGP